MELAKSKELRKLSKAELEETIKLAIGRILRMGSRKSQPGDIEEYERCRSIVFECVEIIG